MPKERRSLPLTLDQWAHLENLAETHEALARGGPKTGQSSWRVLLRMIADGDLLILTREALAEGMRAMEGIKALAAKTEEAGVPRIVRKAPP